MNEQTIDKMCQLWCWACEEIWYWVLFYLWPSSFRFAWIWFDLILNDVFYFEPLLIFFRISKIRYRWWIKKKFMDGSFDILFCNFYLIMISIIIIIISGGRNRNEFLFHIYIPFHKCNWTRVWNNILFVKHSFFV